MARIKDQSYFTQRSNIVASDMLGRTLVTVDSEGNKKKLTLTEIAAYEGVTKTTASGIYDAAGIVSISTKMGHKLIDIATQSAGKPSCVTIRSGVTETGEKISGPGNVSKYLGITKQTQNNYEFAPIYASNKIYLEGESTDPAKISQGMGNSDNCLGFFRIN